MEWFRRKGLVYSARRDIAGGIIGGYAEIIKSFPKFSIEEIVAVDTEKNKGKGWIEGLNSVKGSVIDFKIHSRKVFEVVYSGVRHNQVLSIDIGYVLSKLFFQESRIDDVERDVKYC